MLARQFSWESSTVHSTKNSSSQLPTTGWLLLLQMLLTPIPSPPMSLLIKPPGVISSRCVSNYDECCFWQHHHHYNPRIQICQPQQINGQLPRPIVPVLPDFNDTATATAYTTGIRGLSKINDTATATAYTTAQILTVQAAKDQTKPDLRPA